MRRLLLLAIAAGFALWSAAPPAAAEHTLPSGCAFRYPFPIPNTYEALQNRGVYLAGEEVAAYNMIAPNDTFFGIPTVEAGPRSDRSTTTPYIPPALLKAIGYIESGLAQADHSVYWGAVGPTKVSFDCGHGIMQVTSSMISPQDNGWPSSRQSLVATHYLYNIARGAAILVDKWNYAPQVRPIVGDGNPYIIEDWYYALWSYNGFAGVNNPLNPAYDWPRTGYSCGPLNDGYGHSYADYPYQELVFGCASRPPSVSGRQLWAPQAISLPNLSDSRWLNPLSNFPTSSLMDFPTPSPLHLDPTARPHWVIPVLLKGSPELAVNRTAVAGDVNQVTISNTGDSIFGSILAWRAKPQQSWISVNKQAGVALEPSLSCTPGFPCQRSPTLTITVNSASAPPAVIGGVTIESLTTGERRVVRVHTRVADHFLTPEASQPANATAAGYRWGGVAAYVSPQARPGWVPLYRLWNGAIGDHFYTASAAVRDGAVALYGYRYEWVAGYVSPTPAAGLAPLYRLWNGAIGDHFYTTSAAVRDGAVAAYGYGYEGVAGYVSAGPAAGLVPFFHWWNGAVGDHFYTISSDEPGAFSSDPYHFGGVAAYVAPAARPGWVPLYRLWKGGAVGDHFYTTSAAVRDGAVALYGYRYEGVVGYVSPVPAAGLVPLYRLWNGAIGDHFYTTSAAVRDGAVAAYGYRYEGVAGYVSAGAAPGLVPLFHWWLR